MSITVPSALLGCLLLMLQAPALSQTADEHDTHHTDASSSAPPAPQSAQGNEAPSAQQMQGAMQNMQELMNKINTTKDPAERQKLLDQHMQAMQQQMDVMSSMMGSNMMAGPGVRASTGNATNCQDMMGGNMKMMKAMMEQMQQHEAATKSN